jgi:hypothetical protein
MKDSFEHLTLAQASQVKYVIANGSGTSRIEKFLYGKDSFKIDLNLLIKTIEEL